MNGSDEYKQTLRDAIREHGVWFHFNLLKEEAAELIVALSHYERDRATADQVIEELADVNIVSDAIRLILDNEVGFEDIKTTKMERLKKRMQFKSGMKFKGGNGE